jgi:hypothetical protein
MEKWLTSKAVADPLSMMVQLRAMPAFQFAGDHAQGIEFDGERIAAGSGVGPVAADGDAVITRTRRTRSVTHLHDIDAIFPEASDQ